MVHPGNELHVHEEGSFSASSSRLPVLHYYPIRGRAEPIRLVLAYKHQPWFEPPVEPIDAIKRQDLEGYPFRQLPRFIDEVHGDVDLVQSHAIMRHLGRKYGLYGSNMQEAFQIDMIMDGVADVRAKLRVLWVDQDFREPERQRYIDNVLAQEEQLTKSDMQGPGMFCFEYMLQKSRFGRHGWLVGSEPSIADFLVFDLVDVHLAKFPEEVHSRFPQLCQHHTNMSALDGVKEYMEGDRHTCIFASDWVKAKAKGGAPDPVVGGADHQQPAMEGPR